MELSWFIAGFGLILAWFISYATMASIRGKFLKKLRKYEPEIYARILGNRQSSWLERGWYSPSDISVVHCLHQEILSQENSRLGSTEAVNRYLKMRKTRLYTGFALFGLYFPITFVLAIFG